MTQLLHKIEASAEFASRYALAEPLGEGGFARVFRAVQRSTGQSVAVKILEPAPDASPRSSERRAERFRREVELCARLHHPHVARLIDAGSTQEGWPYTVFEFIPGRSLDALLQEGPLDIQEAAYLMGQVLDAIGHAHRQGVLHRDLKPANVMVSEDGPRRNAHVLDFGIGGLAHPESETELRRLTGTDELIGSPSYAAPEQLRGQDCSERSDLYSWGLVLLECLTGRPPFEAASLEQLMELQLGPEPAKVPYAVQRLPIHNALARSIAKDPRERAASTEELATLLEEAMPSVFHASRRTDTGVSDAVRLQQLTALSLRARWRDSVDPEKEQVRIRAFFEAATSAIGAHGGAIGGSMGSRVLALFGYPRPTEQAARAALEAAATVREQLRDASGPLGGAEVFAGVRSGSLLVPENASAVSVWSPIRSGVAGGAMELDLRAGPGEIWACDDTRRMLRGHTPFEPAQDDGRTRMEIASGPLPLRAFRLGTELERLREPDVSSTPMVGRDAELARLADAWRRCRDGQPQAVLVAGEAGIGKSRLVRELRRGVGDALWIQCRCTPESENSPLQPIVEWLRASTRGTPLETMLEDLKLDPATHHPLLSELIGAPPHPDYPSRPMPAQHKRDRTLNSLLSLLLSRARRGALVFVVEDLHWADPSTRELLLRLVRELRSASIFDPETDLQLLTVLTARAEFEPPWTLSEVPLIQLSRLPRSESEMLVRALAWGGAAVPEAAVAALVERADGVPLFLEEMAQMARESASSKASEDAFSKPLPATLRDLLSARIGGLRARVRSTVQVASCLGREFELPLLQAVSERAPAALRDDLEALVSAGLLIRRASGSAERYAFHHALLSDAAHDLLRDRERREIHLRIARSLEAPPFEETARLHPERVARHFEEAGVLDRAVDLWQRAAGRASAGSALPEAIHHYDRALALISQLPESAERDHGELALRIAKGTAHMMTEGYASEHAERAFERAFELCNRYPHAPQLFSTLNGLWGYNLVRGETSTINTLVARLTQMAEESGSERRLLFARSAAGASAFLAGRLDEALPYLEEATARLEAAWGAPPPRPGAPAWQRQAANTPMYLAWCLHLMGRSDEAARRAQQGLALAEELQDVDAHVEAMIYQVAIFHDRREPKRALELLDRVLPQAEEYGLIFWLGVAKASRGWARAHLGEVESGISEIREGLEIFRRSGARVPLVYRACHLAEALGVAHRPADGIAALDTALELSRGRVDRFFDAEALRIRGELQRQHASAGGDRAGSEATLQSALELAASQGARLIELRAASSLARGLAAEGRHAEARSLLAPIRDRIDQGAELADLVEADALLASLS